MMMMMMMMKLPLRLAGKGVLKNQIKGPFRTFTLCTFTELFTAVRRLRLSGNSAVDDRLKTDGETDTSDTCSGLCRLLSLSNGGVSIATIVKVDVGRIRLI